MLRDIPDLLPREKGAPKHTCPAAECARSCRGLGLRHVVAVDSVHLVERQIRHDLASREAREFEKTVGQAGLDLVNRAPLPVEPHGDAGCTPILSSRLKRKPRTEAPAGT